MKPSVKDGLLPFEKELMRPRLLSNSLVRRGFIVAALGFAIALEPMMGCAASMTAETKDRISTVISGQESQEEAKKALDNAYQYAPADTRAVLDKVPENYKKASELVKRLKVDRQDALSRVNFAYAIAALGEKKASDLHDKLGMEYFLRYSKKTLEELYGNMLGSCECGKPLLVAAFNKNDWNGHFYREGMDLEQFTRYYKLMIVEVDGEDSFYSQIANISENYGKIETLIIAGHGSSGSIQLGKPDEKGELDLSDFEELQAVRKYFKAMPTVILASCSTGESDNAIGAVLSKAWEAHVYAPVKAITRTYYNLDAEGKITRVTYDVDAKGFKDGVGE